MTYLWSDAWILQAIALATCGGPADLTAVIASADDVNHALPTDDELRGALRRLVDGGYIQESASKFQLTGTLPPEVVVGIRSARPQEGRRKAEEILRSEAWTPGRNVGDPRNDVEYPGLTDQVLHQANEEYLRRMRKGSRGKDS